jgi:hypothetical protein
VDIPLRELIEGDFFRRSALVHGFEGGVDVFFCYVGLELFEETAHFFAIDGTRIIGVEFIEDGSDFGEYSFFGFDVPFCEFLL